MPQELPSVDRMSRDIALAAKNLSDEEARFLVDAYYMMQDDRKRSNNQVRALGEAKEPNSVLLWLAMQSETLESQIKRALDKYTESHPMGSWMREIVGIGPVISAGLLAHIDIAQAPTVGHIWRYAGLDPTSTWLGRAKAEELVSDTLEALQDQGRKEKVALDYAAFHIAEKLKVNGENLIARAKNEDGNLTRAGLVKALAKRPWNAQLKTLCWKAGQSFMKFSGRDDCFYGKKYLERKAYEIARNDRGDNAELAASLVKKVGKSTEAYKHLSEGKLPPGQIDARARRWAVKLFLAHLHEEWYRRHFGTEPPLPYPIAFLGHAHKIESPV